MKNSKPMTPRQRARFATLTRRALEAVTAGTGGTIISENALPAPLGIIGGGIAQGIQGSGAPRGIEGTGRR